MIIMEYHGDINMVGLKLLDKLWPMHQFVSYSVLLREINMFSWLKNNGAQIWRFHVPVFISGNQTWLAVFHRPFGSMIYPSGFEFF